MQNKDWLKKEFKDAKDFSGDRHKGSGNHWSRPGDVSTSTLLIDSKYTEKQSYSITLKTWDKIYEEALFSFRTPVLSLQIRDLELVVLSKEDFLEILNGRDSKD